MLRKLVALTVVIVFALGSFAYAQDSDNDVYQAKLAELNQQMKQLRDDYKGQMKKSDDSIREQFKAAGTDKAVDKDTRQKLLAQKREEKKQLQMDYRNKQDAIRAQVKALKAQYKGSVKGKAGTKVKKEKKEK